MANPRDVDLDIVGHDKTDAATRSAARNLDRLKRKADENGKASRRLINTSQLATRALGDMARGAAVAAGAVGAVGAVGLTAAPFLAKFVVAVGKVAAQTAPAAAALLPLAAGFVFLKHTIATTIAPLGKALNPISRGLEQSEKHARRFVDDGIRPLAREFRRANLPDIAKAQERIAKQLNESARAALKWTNSAKGQKAIHNITRDTAGAFERLAPALLRTATSAGDLAGRISKVSFRELGGGAKYALDKLRRLMNGISSKDVKAAFSGMRDLGRQAGAGIRKIGDGLEWVKTHQKTILALKTSLGVLAVVVGFLAGNPMIALGGAAALVVTWWGRLKTATHQVRQKLIDLYNTSPALQEAFATIKAGVDTFRKGVQNFLAGAAPGFKSFARDIQPLLREIAPILAKLATKLLTLAAVALTVAGVVVGAFLFISGKVARVVAFLLGKIREFSHKTEVWFLAAVAGVMNGIADLLGWLGKIPGFAGGAFRRMSESARNGARAVQARIDALNTRHAQTQVDTLKARLQVLGRQKPTPKVAADISRLTRALNIAQGRVDRLHGKSVVITATYRKVIQTINKAAVNSGNNKLFAGGVGFARTAPGGNYRTGGPTMPDPIFNATTYVTIDGAAIDARAKTVFDKLSGAQRHRARVGRR